MVWSSFLIKKSEQLDIPSHHGQYVLFPMVTVARWHPLTGKRGLCDLFLAILKNEELKAVRKPLANLEPWYVPTYRDGRVIWRDVLLRDVVVPQIARHCVVCDRNTG